jgi:hypothetical protein
VNVVRECSPPIDEPTEPRTCPAVDVIGSLVLLIGSADVSAELRLGAMDALLSVHRPDVVRYWNNDSKYLCMHTFWYIGYVKVGEII